MAVVDIILAIFRVLIWPLTALLSLIATIISPAVYIVQYSIAPFLLLLRIIPSLEPLYIYFGCAAFVGIIAGLGLQATSSLTISIFGLDQPEQEYDLVRAKKSGLQFGGVKRLQDDQSSQESDWQWLEKASEPNTRKRRTQGLLSQTILEEEDDSE